MKISFITNGDVMANANIKRATGMANYFIMSGWHVDIVILDSENNRKRIELECPEANAKFFSDDNFISQITQKIKILKSDPPDIVYVCAPSIRNFINKYNTGLKKTIFIMLHSELFSSANIGYLNRIKYYFMELSTLFLYDGHIVVSKYLENYFIKKIKIFGLKKPVLYSPDAYNIDYKKLIKNDTGLSFPGKKILLYMGSLTLGYGFLEIIQAIEIIRKKQDDFILLILGDGKDRSLGEDFVKKNNLSDTVFFMGHIFENDIYSYLNIADVFISPLNDTIQDWARCPSKLYMYLPFNKPIVTCRIGEAQELFGDDGYYYKPNDISDFARVIEVALKENEPKYHIDIHKYTWKYCVELFLNWRKKLIKYE